jgi:hypothetical protein
LCITNPSRSTFHAAQTYTEFTMLPQGHATGVGWRMHGPLPFMGKVMHLFMDMDKMIGRILKQAETAHREIIDQPKRQKRSKR